LTKITREDADYMIGREIENTPAKGKQTLFLAKWINPVTISKIRPEFCTHLYFGANKSFPKEKLSAAEWNKWVNTITVFLHQGFQCTLDIPLSQYNDLMETSLVKHPNFIMMLSIELPSIQQAGYNACLKLDDVGVGGVNGGVWVHTLHDLRTKESYTSWHDYGRDKMAKLQPRTTSIPNNDASNN
jgi:hypothetical protein